MKSSMAGIVLLFLSIFNTSYSMMQEERKELSTASSGRDTYLEINDLKAFQNIKLVSDVDDEDWDFLPSKLKTLDISNINSISERGFTKLKSMDIEELNISNLNLHDGDLHFLPNGLKRLDISGNPIGGVGLTTLPSTLEIINIKNTLIFEEAISRFLSKPNLHIIR